MPNLSETMKAELKELIEIGMLLHLREMFKNLTPQERASAVKAFKPASPASSKKRARAKSAQVASKPKDAVSSTSVPDALDDFAAKLAVPVNFKTEYQSWYSRSLRVIEQLLPDRYEEFRELYKLSRRKTIDVETYGIYDYLAGITVTRAFGTELVFNNVEVAMQKLDQQVNILRSVSARLDSLIVDIHRVLQASIIDDELAAARALLRSKHIRSAGVIAGVTLEAHLKQLVRDHQISMRKTANLANLNEALKSSQVYGVPEWRQIQHIGDIRNLCAHKSDREPAEEEVTQMINQVDRIIHSIY